MKSKFMNTGLSLLLFSMLFIAQAQTARAEAVAMITDLQGQATLSNDLSSMPAEILNSLYPGNKLSLEKNTKLAMAYYSTGREYAFTGPATIELGDEEPDLLNGKAASSRELKLIKEIGLDFDDGYLNQAAIVMRGLVIKKRQIKLLSPVNSKLLHNQTDFHWQSFADNMQYRFTLMDGEGRNLFETLIVGNKFKLPDSVKLPPGMLYRWMLEARLDTDEAYVSSAGFELVSDSVQQEVNGLRPAKEASFSELLIYARFMQQQGFAVESGKYWEMLSKQRPDSAELQKLSK